MEESRCGARAVYPHEQPCRSRVHHDNFAPFHPPFPFELSDQGTALTKPSGPRSVSKRLFGGEAAGRVLSHSNNSSCRRISCILIAGSVMVWIVRFRGDAPLVIFAPTILLPSSP